MATTRSASLVPVVGPRFATGCDGDVLRVLAYTVERGTRQTPQIIVSGYRRPVPGLTAVFIVTASSTRP